MGDRGNILYQDQTLYFGDWMNVKPGFRLIMQLDGNCVLYDSGNPVWDTKTSGNVDSSITMQRDGNLVVYKPGGVPIWASQTGGVGKGPFRLVLQQDRNLVIYDGTGTPTWASKSNK